MSARRLQSITKKERARLLKALTAVPPTDGDTETGLRDISDMQDEPIHPFSQTWTCRLCHRPTTGWEALGNWECDEIPDTSVCSGRIRITYKQRHVPLEHHQHAALVPLQDLPGIVNYHPDDTILEYPTLAELVERPVVFGVFLGSIVRINVARSYVARLHNNNSVWYTKGVDTVVQPSEDHPDDPTISTDPAMVHDLSCQPRWVFSPRQTASQKTSTPRVVRFVPFAVMRLNSGTQYPGLRV